LIFVLTLEMFYIKSIKLFLVIGSLCCINFVFASNDKNHQKLEEQLQTAKYYLERTMYEDAKKLLVELDKNNTGNKDIQIMLMQVNMFSKQYKDVILWSDKILSNNDDLPPFVFMMRGDAALQLQQYEIAKQAYEKSMAMPNTPTSMRNKATKEYNTLNFQLEQMRSPQNIVLKNFSTDINTSLDEYYPVLTADGNTFIFTRMDGRQEDIYLAKYINNIWVANPVDALNTPDNEGAASITTDGKMIFYTACNRMDGLGSCDIFYAMQQGNGEWMNAGGIGKPINSSSWESQPFYHTQLRTLYFSAIREGGSGGRDIWYSTLDANNHWTTPLNMGAVINSSGDEETPFLHPDGVTLYFASTGHQGMGGKDIFMSKKNPDGTWTNPLNMGYPLNTPKDESGFFVSTDGKNAYIASTRDSGKGRLDVYTFELPEVFRPQPASYLSLNIKDIETHKLLAADYQIMDIVADTKVFSGTTDNEGKIVTPLPAGKEYMLIIDKSNYLPYSENFAMITPKDYAPYEKTIYLSPIKKGNTFILKNVFFAVNAYDLDSKSFAELDNLVDYLQKNPTLHLEISGHTDNTGNLQANKLLSENRAKSVVNYLISKGINANRLEFKGYGDTKPIADNATEEGKSQNRRTECKLIE
jgi:outer membrane protein OmpA-like peptidoglycan-associated protein